MFQHVRPRQVALYVRDAEGLGFKGGHGLIIPAHSRSTPWQQGSWLRLDGWLTTLKDVKQAVRTVVR